MQTESRRPAAAEAGINQGDGPVRDFFQDIQYTLRLLGRAPAFTAIAVATLALRSGANTAIFAVVNTVLLKPLPFAEAERLMLVHILVPDRAARSSPNGIRPSSASRR
jgi:hypothetical protein